MPLQFSDMTTNYIFLVCDVDCDFVIFPFPIMGQVWYLNVLFPDLFSFLLWIEKTRKYICNVIINNWKESYR